MRIDHTIRGVALVALVVQLAGCGLSAYEERLAKTDQRNRYWAKLDAALDPYWSQAAYGLWLRAPKGMRSIPAPVKPKGSEELPPDLRQEFQGVPLDLPGIIQCWEGLLPTAGGGTGPYRLYVLGNHSRFARSDDPTQSTEPKEFLKDLEIVLQNLYGVTLPPGDSGRGDQNNVKFRQQIPTNDQFVLPKTFQVVNFVPETAGQQPFHAWLYEHTTEQVQVALLMLTPEASSNEVRQTLTTALETIQVSPVAPSLQAGTPGGAPGGTF